jgi:hypothetical protein
VAISGLVEGFCAMHADMCCVRGDLVVQLTGCDDWLVAVAGLGGGRWLGCVMQTCVVHWGVVHGLWQHTV